jgi:hypothetical protein
VCMAMSMSSVMLDAPCTRFCRREIGLAVCPGSLKAREGTPPGPAPLVR